MPRCSIVLVAVSWFHVTFCATLSVNHTRGKLRIPILWWAHNQLWLVIWQWCTLFLFKFHSCWCGCKVKYFHFSCIWLGFWEKRVRSFVNSTLPSCVSSVHCIPLFLPDVVVFIILSVTKRERERGLVTVNTLDKFLSWPQNSRMSD